AQPPPPCLGGALESGLDLPARRERDRRRRDAGADEQPGAVGRRLELAHDRRVGAVGPAGVPDTEREDMLAVARHGGAPAPLHPRRGSRSAPKIGTRSTAGSGSQSIEPSVATSATVRPSPIAAYEAIGA